VNNNQFSRRLLLTFNIHIMVFQLSNPKDEKIGVTHVRDGKKYPTHYQLSEVTKVSLIWFRSSNSEV
jgi:hypothetical protein